MITSRNTNAITSKSKPLQLPVEFKFLTGEIGRSGKIGRSGEIFTKFKFLTDNEMKLIENKSLVLLTSRLNTIAATSKLLKPFCKGENDFVNDFVLPEMV